MPDRRFIAAIAAIVAIAALPAMGEERRAISHDGVERSYLIDGRRVAREGTAPVVIVLHGGGGNAENAVRMTGFTGKAKAEGFLVVYPNGTSRRFTDKFLTWNTGHCCGSAMRENVDDVGFISALIDELVARDGADPERIYVTGMSNGAMMAHRLGIELSGKIAAIAPVVGGLFGDETAPPHPVAALMINGALDKSIPLAGGMTGGRAQAWDGSLLKPADFQGEFWAKANVCQPTAASVTPAQDVRLKRYDCAEGRDVEFYIIDDNGHAWPGGEKGSRRGDTPSTSLNATDVIWDFFRTKSR